MARVTFGSGGDLAATTGNIHDVIYAGHNWLVFLDDEISWGETIELDKDANNSPISRFLRFEGAGMGDSTPNGGRTVFKKAANFTTGPMLRSTGHLDADGKLDTFVHLFMTGITCYGNNISGAYPFFDLNVLDRSRFVDCAFIGNSADGLSLGGINTDGQAATSAFENCVFQDNKKNGCAAVAAVDLTFNRCSFLDNGRLVDDPPPQNKYAGLYYAGITRDTHESYKHRGLGAIKDCYFSTINVAARTVPPLCAWIVNAFGVDIKRNVIDKGNIELYNTDPLKTKDCWVHRVKQLNNAGITIGDASNLAQATVTLS